MSYIKKIYLFLNMIRFLPHILMFLVSEEKHKIENDLEVWSGRFLGSIPIGIIQIIKSFVWLLTFKKEYRNVFSHRIRQEFPLLFHVCNLIAPRLDSLYIPTSNIGGGLFIEHGFSTIIAAKKIGENCSVYQQVTIGYSNDNKAPIIGKNVIIYPGAKVIGGITIGDNVVIGANAVVVKDVPDNCTVVGIPAYIVSRNGQKVVEKL